jgi:transposase-like protein
MSDARPPCPKCAYPQVSKNGHVQSVQRWKCRSRTCGYEFTRTTPRGEPAAKHALALLLYSMGRASYGIIARVLKVSRTTVYRWVRHTAIQLPEPTIPLEITEIEFDEMWHYIGSKKTGAGSGKPWTVIHGEFSPGSSVVVMLPPSAASMNG